MVIMVEVMVLVDQVAVVEPGVKVMVPAVVAVAVEQN
tara:strand:- start:117 stop:227 length:111 start_codon:yes stop_codon:yes gene_type:complete